LDIKEVKVRNKRENLSFYDEEHGMIFGTLTPGTDLMEGIIREYEKYNVTSGIVTCIGSVSEATFVNPEVEPNGNVIYSDPIIVKGPLEVLNGTGFLCINEEDRTDCHMHASFVNTQGIVSGGHIVSGKNPVLVMIEFAIQVGKGIRAVREFKPELGFQTIQFRRGE
jgi:uncharacterized protein